MSLSASSDSSCRSPISRSPSSASCGWGAAGGRRQRPRGDDPARHAHGRDDVGEVVAAGQRALKAVPGLRQGLRVVGCDRAERRQPDRPEQLHRDVDDPGGEAAVLRCRVGHPDRQQRQERGAGAEPEREEREEQAGEVAGVHALDGKQGEPDDDCAEAQRQRAHRTDPFDEPRRDAERHDRDRERQRHERQAGLDRVVAEHPLEVQGAEEEGREHARDQQPAHQARAHQHAQPQHAQRHDRVGDPRLQRRGRPASSASEPPAASRVRSDSRP